MTAVMESMGHVDQEQLLQYFSGELDDSAEERVEIHLYECDECSERSRKAHATLRAWEQWTAAAHGAAHVRRMLAEALAAGEGQASNPAWRSRLRRWREKWAGTAEAALHALFDASGRAIAARANQVDALIRPGSMWQFEPQPSFGGTWGAGDDDETAVFATAKLSSRAPRALVEIGGDGQCEIVVRIDQIGEIAAGPPLVILIGIQPEGEPHVRIVEVVPQPGTNTGVARFSRLPPGEYIIAFEPIASDDEALVT